MIIDGLARQIGGDGVDGVAGLAYDSQTSSGNVFVGFLPATPDRCVAIIANGGFDADALLPYDKPNVQIFVRGEADSPKWALDMWQAIYNYIEAKRNMTLPDGTYLLYAQAIQSGPVHIGKDDNGRHQFSLNLRTEILNTTAERP